MLATPIAQVAQPLGQFAGRGQAVLGRAAGAVGDVAAQQLVADLALPAGGQRAAQIAHRQLVQHHAQRIEIGLHRRRVSQQQLRRQVQRRTADRLQRMQAADAGDAPFSQARRVGQGAAAEIGQAHPRRAIAALVYKDIGRLQILVQHADRVRHRHGVGHLGQQFQAQRQRQPCHAAVRLRPLRQAQAAVFALDEERRLVEAPVEHPHQVVALAQGALQQPRQGCLALQRRQALAVRAELEHPLRARIHARRLRRQPHLAAGGDAQFLFQQPVGTAGHRIAGLEAEARLRPGRRLASQHRHGQAVTDLVGGDDDRLGFVAQRFAQLADGVAEGVLAEIGVAPHRLQQFLLGHRLAGMAQQAQQDFQRPRLQLDRLARHAQLPLQLVEFRPGEFPDRRTGLGGLQILFFSHVLIYIQASWEFRVDFALHRASHSADTPHHSAARPALYPCRGIAAASAIHFEHPCPDFPSGTRFSSSSPA